MVGPVEHSQKRNKIYRDSGFSFPEPSFAFATSHMNLIGKIVEVEIYGSTRDDQKLIPKMMKFGNCIYRMRVKGLTGEVWLSGASCGLDTQQSWCSWKVLRFITVMQVCTAVVPDFPLTPIGTRPSILPYSLRWFPDNEGDGFVI